MQVQTDATCVRVLCSRKLLVGIGNQLFLLHVESDGSTRRLSADGCLPRLKDKIHSIDCRKLASGSWLVVLHAGREAYSLELGEDNTFSQLGQFHLFNRTEHVLYDPQAMALLTYARRRLNDWISTMKLLGDDEACLITDHGVAIRLQRDYFGSWYASDTCACEDGSTLYCSQIVGTSWEDALCFSGTALGLLVIWRPFGPEKGQILYSAPAHNGVIFSIECDLAKGFVTTTSDDRSVKFWKMQEGGKGMELKELSYCFGHTARVFQSRIIQAGGANWVVSIGEDSNLCLWDESGNRIHRQRMEDGATLWNLDYDESTMTVFVCASNGNVSKFEIGRFLEPSQDHLVVRDVTPDMKDEHPTKVKFCEGGAIVTVTNHNRILLLRDSQEPEAIDQLREQFKCSILEVSDDRIFVAGNRWLNIYELSDGSPSSPKARKLSHSSDKSPSVFLLKHLELDFNLPELVQEEEPIQFSIIRSLHISRSDVVMCDNNGRCLIYDQNVEILKSCHRLPKASERWLTSAFRLDSQFLLLADRNGNLYLFDSLQRDPIFKLPFLHGKLGVTHIQLEEETPEGFFLLTTGHDSNVRSIFLDRTERRLQLYEARKTTVHWIERLTCSGQQKPLVMGFNDSHFVVTRTDQQDVLLEVDCGGGHRYWDFLLSNGHIGCFVFIQHKRLKLVTANWADSEESRNLLQVPRLCWHTKACNVVKVLRHNGTTTFISGGEDNVLRINRVSPDIGTLLEQPKKHLDCHISSIKTIQLIDHPQDRNKVLILSAGGRAQLCLTALDPAQLHRTKQELSYMLHSSDSDRSRWRKNRTASFDPETRFMCSVQVESHVFVGCSDGFLRQFTISRDENAYKAELVHETNYGRCILHMTKLSLGTGTILLTMATDGNVCFWDASNLAEPFYHLKHHASGINGFDLKPLASDGQFLLATGGDDQKVVVTRFHLSTGAQGKISFFRQRSVVGDELHIAQITGVRFSGEATLWSVGVDQRVILTDFSGWKKMVVLKQLGSCIADVKGLELVPESRSLFVYGCGFEFIGL